MSSSWTRQRVSQACKSCQTKKIKCGGEIPHCETCIRLNRRCSYGVSRRNTRRSVPQAVTTVSTLPTPDEVELASASGEEIQSTPATERCVSAQLTTRQSIHLFEKYFRHIHPIWPLLYKPLYEPIGYHQLAEHLSKAVVYAIYAIASCLQDEDEPEHDTNAATREPALRPFDNSPNHFFEAALAELQSGKQGKGDLNMIHALRPSISHCQAFTILALQQHGVAEFTRASLFCSLAASMAIDLRLHQSCGPEGSAEREVGSRLWWNIYILEKMMSFEMGRPMAWRFEEANAPFPSTEESDEYELFRPPRDRRRDASRQQVSLAKMQTLTAFHTTIELCRLMERISCEIYSAGARELIRQTPASGDATRMKLWSDVQAWRLQRQCSSLSLDLSQDGVTLPVVVTNHVQICSVTIVLHRPFISPWLQQLSVTGQPPFDTPSPSEICYKAAEEICAILESYRRYIPQLPCDLIFPIFTAASTLLHEIRHSPTEVADRQQRLKLCLSWLSLFSKNWQNAREREKMLYELYETPGSPLVQTSSPIQERESSMEALEGRGTPPRAMASASEMQPTNYLSALDHDHGDSTDGFPGVDMEFWMFLQGQHIWSG